MNAAAQIALAVMIASALIDAPGFGYDAFRAPFVMAAAAILMAAGAVRREPDARIPAWTAAAAVAFGASHVLSALLAVDGWAAAGALAPVGAGLAVFAAVSRGWVRLDHLFRFAAAAALAAGSIALWQRGRTGLSVPLLGNTNYAGCLAALLAIPCLAGTLSEGGSGRRLLCGAGTAAALAGLWVSQSRAGLVGLAAGVLVLAAVAPGPRRIRLGAAMAVLLAAGAAGHHRIATIFSVDHPTNRVRLELWKGTLDLAAARPWTGCGPGNFRVWYPRHRRESEARIHDRDRLEFTEAEDPHNTHLSIAAELGLPGILSWAVLLGSLAAAGARARSWLPATGLAGLAAFVAAGSFNTLRQFSPFDAFFWLFAGLAVSGGASSGRRPGIPAAAGMALGLMAVVPAILTAGAQKAFDRAMRTDDPLRRIESLEAALTWRPSHWRARYELGNSLRFLSEREDEGAGERNARALEEYEAVLRTRPWNVQALNYAGWCAFLDERTDEAIRRLREAERLAPWYFLTQYHMAFLEETLGGRRRRLEEALRRGPGFAPARFWMGETHLLEALFDAPPETEREDRRREALRWFGEAESLGFDVAGRLRELHPGLEGDPDFAPLFEGRLRR